MSKLCFQKSGVVDSGQMQWKLPSVLPRGSYPASYADSQSLLLGPAFPAETTLRILSVWHQWICSKQSVFVSQDKDNDGACDG